MSKTDLYELAQKEDIEGRSSMDHDQLVDALDKHFNAAEQQAAPAGGGAKPAPAPSKEDRESIGKTDHTKSANENVAAGGQPTGSVPGGTS